MKLPTINIKGNEYVMVKDRIMAFNEQYPDGSIHTEIVKNDENSVICKATVYPVCNEPNHLFTGHSEAYREGSMGDVPVEVAETSAVGRALAMLGIGIIESVASADEINKSEKRSFGKHADTMAAGKATPKQVEYILNLAMTKGITNLTKDEVEKYNSWQASQKIEELKKIKPKVKTEADEETELDIGLEHDQDEIDKINAELSS